MIEVRIEFKNVKCERIAKHLAKMKAFEYKIWEYNNTVYALIKLSSILAVNELIRKLKRNRIEFHFSRINSSLNFKEKVCKVFV